MKSETKITILLIVILFITGIAVFIAGFSIFDLLNISTEKNGWLTYSLFLLIIIVILIPISLFIDRQFRKPLFFFIRWIDHLSNGTYKRPAPMKNFSLNKMRFSPFIELKSKLDGLTSQLNKAKKDQRELDETRRNWATGVSHDLKTPLTYIKGYAAMLRSEHKWDEKEIKEFAHIIKEKSLYMEQLIDDLSMIYEFDKMQIPLNLREMDVSIFLESVLDKLSQYPMAKDYNIMLKGNNDKILLTFDQKLLTRALENFIMNAIHHNPQGTTIVVSIEKKEDSVLIEIKDNGIGMDEKSLQQLFNRYYRGTTTDMQHGSGLGMSIAKQFIEKQGGKIEVGSKPNLGTKIKVLFPK